MIVDFAEPSVDTDGTAPHLPDFSKLPSMKYQVDDLKDYSALLVQEIHTVWQAGRSPETRWNMSDSFAPATTNLPSSCSMVEISKQPNSYIREAQDI